MTAPGGAKGEGTEPGQHEQAALRASSAELPRKADDDRLSTTRLPSPHLPEAPNRSLGTNS